MNQIFDIEAGKTTVEPMGCRGCDGYCDSTGCSNSCNGSCYTTCDVSCYGQAK